MKIIALLFPLLSYLLALPSFCVAPDEISDHHAKVFLTRATFGPTPESIQQLKQLGYEGWVDQQLAMPISQSIVNRTMQIAMQAEPTTDWFASGSFTPPRSSPYWVYFNSAWWEQALTAPDQLRQRVAYALSEIFVVSYSATPYLRNRADAMAAWADLLQSHSTGNFRELMSAVSYSPAMGVFLTYNGNRKYNPAKGSAPDENYARELMQLFTLGLYQTDLSGRQKQNKDGQPIPTYTQDDVMNLARVFTGWDIQGNRYFGQRPQNGGYLMAPMEFTEKFHDNDEKTILGSTIPAGLDGKDDVEAALDILFAQTEVAPFISKLLIQRLTTSNPTPQYIERVASVFQNNGQGTRGDLVAVIKAILLDDDAIASISSPTPTFGKVKEPVIMLSQFLRAMDVTPSPEFMTKHGGIMQGVYWVRNLRIGQDPFQASSVFNFFDDDFSPADLPDDMLSPELQVLDSSALVGFSNLLQFTLSQRETVNLNAMSEKRREEIERRRESSRISLELNISEELSVLKEQGPEHVFKLLEGSLLARPASENTRRVVIDALEEGAGAKRNAVARARLADAIRLLATSPDYWVQQ